VAAATQTPAARQPGADHDLAGKTIVITGANSGVGYATAEALVRRGALVVMVCRDRTRGDAARSALAATAGGPGPELFVADLSSQAEVRRVAGELTTAHPRVDVLVNNAGSVFDHRELSVDGVEMTLAVNHLAPFLLTELLLPPLLAAPNARVVTVSSEAYARKLDFENLQGERRYGFLSAYGRSKLANVLFTRELADRLEGSTVTANAASPGPTRTRFGDNLSGPVALFPKVMKRMPFFGSPEKAARTVVYAAVSPETAGVSGRFFLRSREWRDKRVVRNRELARRLWRVSEELCHIDPAASHVSVVAAREGDGRV
jgi:NAD(P)-dependent dehydrogenase (short-subunit alcohol dehydrogenase family)